MKTQITLKAAIGRTLTGIAESYGSETALIFGDVFVNLKALSGYDGSDASIEERDLSVFDFGDQALIESGIATEKEIQDLRDERHRRYVRAEEAAERRRFEELSRKYGKGGEINAG